MRVLLVVGALVVLEGGDGRVEQRVGLRVAAGDDDVALVELEAHPAVDALLGVVDEGLQREALGAPPVAVVDHAGVARHEVVLEVGDFAVERDRFDGAVGAQQDGAARGFIAAAALHADVAVFHQVEAADAVLAAELVELGEQLVRLHAGAVDGDQVPLLEFQVDVFGGIGRGLRRHGPAPHGFLGLGGGVLEVAAFEGDVQQVGVHRVGRTALLVLHLDGDAVLFGVGEQLLARQQVPLAPRGDDLHARHQRVVAEFEADLVVALAGGAVRDGLGAGGAGDLDLALGDQRTGDGGAEQVLALINRVGAEHREDEVAHELFAQVVDEDVLGLDAELERLGARGLELFALAEVGGEGDHFALVGVLQPLQDDRSVQPAGVGEHYFIDVAHAVFLFPAVLPVRTPVRTVSVLRISPGCGRAPGIPSAPSARAGGSRPRPTPPTAGRR